MTRVFETETPAYADRLIEVVSTPALADLLVYRADSAGAVSHGEGLWTDVADRANAHLTICRVGRGLGQLRVAFVGRRGLAGWTRAHPLRGRLVPDRKAARLV